MFSFESLALRKLTSPVGRWTYTRFEIGPFTGQGKVGTLGHPLT